MKIPLKHIGYQNWRRGRFALYELGADIPGHKQGEWLSVNSLVLAGYTISHTTREEGCYAVPKQTDHR